ncbi:MAG: hypothetical protein HZC55_13140 [Verrucomicrobia bacterium]|nr:hypothetical protein [Verrucomicrobiota bacterium]
MPSTTDQNGKPRRIRHAGAATPDLLPLEWGALRRLLKTLGRVMQDPSGNLRVIRRGRVFILHPPRNEADFASPDELAALRRYLEQSEAISPDAEDPAVHWLLVINHHEARVFRSEIKKAIPERILPHPPADNFRPAPNSRNFTRGREKPDPISFFAAVASALPEGGPILVFGAGTGMSSEMDQFIAWAGLHRPDLAGRIIGSVVVDEKHLSAGQLLAKARAFYASRKETAP